MSKLRADPEMLLDLEAHYAAQPDGMVSVHRSDILAVLQDALKARDLAARVAELEREVAALSAHLDAAGKLVGHLAIHSKPLTCFVAEALQAARREALEEVLAEIQTTKLTTSATALKPEVAFMMARDFLIRRVEALATKPGTEAADA